ncbi:serine/threonine-protein kinase [Dokdonella soli]|uniref:Protein kinase domain-containing protein n=1 Tax=Dokdonella soli TaxID=529810 RepID=A0ABN1IWL6_9GAMM
MKPEDIERLAGRIADDAPLGAEASVSTERSGDRRLLGALRELEQLAQGFRRAQLAGAGHHASSAPALFRFGGLDVLEQLGEGAQGTVWRAYDPLLDQQVALKLRRLDSGDLAHRFLEEGRRLARLRHPNIVNVYGAAVHEGRTGLWTELVRGRSLSDLLAEGGPLPTEDVNAIGRDLCGALAFVHRHGLVHGDVKAGNVMRDAGGRIVLMDFGATQDAGDCGRAVLSGTVQYLAPEVLDGGAPTPASDIYALGVLLYHLLTARYPNEPVADEAPRVLAEHPPALPAGVPRPLAQAIDAALAIDPRQRPPSMIAFAQALNRSVPRARPRRIVGVSVAILLLAAGIFTAVWSSHRAAPAAWQTELALERIEHGASAALQSGATVHLGDHLQLHFRSSEPVWLYVLDDDGDGSAAVLFPTGEEGTTDPLAANVDYTLPASGPHALTWQISSAASGEELLMLASRSPQPELERLIAQWRHAHDSHAGKQRGALVLAPAPSEEALDSADLGEALAAAERSAGSNLRRWRFELPHAD